MQVSPGEPRSLPVADAFAWQLRTSKQASRLLDRLAARLESSTLDSSNATNLHAAADIREEIKALRNLIERDVLKDNEKLINLRNGVIASIARKKAQMEEERLNAESKPCDKMEITNEKVEDSWQDGDTVLSVIGTEDNIQWEIDDMIRSEIDKTTAREKQASEIADEKPPTIQMEPVVHNITTRTSDPPSPPPPMPLPESPTAALQPATALQESPTAVQQLPRVRTPESVENMSHDKLQVLGELIVVDGQNDQHFLTKLVEAVQKEKYDVAAAAKSTGKAPTTNKDLGLSRLPSRPTATDMADRATRSTPGGLDTFMDAFNSNKLNYLKDPKNDKDKLLEGFGKAPAVSPKDRDGFLVPAPVQKAPEARNRRDTARRFAVPNSVDHQEPVRERVNTHKHRRGRAPSTTSEDDSRAQPAFSPPIKYENETKDRRRRPRSRSCGRKDKDRSSSRAHRRKDHEDFPRRSRSPPRATEHKGSTHNRDEPHHPSQSRAAGYQSGPNNVAGLRRQSKQRSANHQHPQADDNNGRHDSESQGTGYQGRDWKLSGGHYVAHSANPENNPDLERRNREHRELTPDFTKHASGWGTHPEDRGSPQWGKADRDDDNWDVAAAGLTSSSGW